MKSSNLTPQVFDRLVARSGGIFHIGITSNGSKPAKLAAASYRCYIKDGNSMLLAIPLECPSFDRTIHSGANVFDLAIQGHFQNRPQIVKNHFEYLFNMGPSRAKSYANNLPKIQGSEFLYMTDQWLQMLRDPLKHKDLTEKIDYEIINGKLRNIIRIKLFLSNGTITNSDVEIDSLEVSQWLFNYS